MLRRFALLFPLRAWGWLFALLPLIGLGLPIAGAEDRPEPSEASEAESSASSSDEARFITESLRGRAVWMAEALKRRFGVESDPDAAESLVALETSDGRLYPIVKDFRGRAFFLDPRLRNVEMELFVRRYEGSPMVQVIRIYTLRDGEKYLLDYWCDICAIPMYYLKDCECCQGPIRIRERPVDEQ